MTTQPEQAVGSDAPVPAADASDPFLDIANEMLPDEEEDQPAEGEEAEEPTAEEADDEPEAEAEDDDLPPIDPPHSLSAEDKEKFKNLPREAQEFTARRIGELEKGFNQKAQEAARAKQEVEQAAYQQLAQYERQVAEQLQQYAQQIGPRRPDPAMLQYDPAGFYAQQAQYEGHVAQQRELQQQAEEYAHQATQREAMAEQAYHEQQRQLIVEHLPDYLDPTMGPKLQQELSAVARELGYPPELIQQARATDIVAMKKVADLKAKADKYDVLMSKKMQGVRAAKGLPRVATPGAPQGAEQTRQARATAAFDRAKGAKSIQDRSEAFADYLTAKGII